MYLVKEAIDNITWRMTPVTYSPVLRQPLVAQLLNQSSDLNTATEWKKKGGHLRAAAISPKFLIPISSEEHWTHSVKASADIDRLTVYQFLIDNLGMDEDKDFVYDRFADGSAASKRECSRRLFRLLARSKKVQKSSLYSYDRQKLRDNGQLRKERPESRQVDCANL